ncbi:MAG: DUF4412 domain-containing protein [Bacteroidia bacterium]|nr:DUF4412 domain-containing protein [Bacteroidia bacterium]
MDRKIFLLLVLVVSSFSSQRISAQTSFEGMLEFKRTEGTVTKKYCYFVKGKKVRIVIYDPAKDNRFGKGTDTSTVILDLDSGTIISLMHERKLWVVVEPKKGPVTPEVSNFSVPTSVPYEDPNFAGNKKIAGQTCRGIAVVLKSENTKVFYWRADEKFDFFNAMMDLLRNKEFYPAYYKALNEPKGTMPFMIIKKQADGTETSKMELIKYEKKVISDWNFEIPAGYVKFGQ